MPRPSGLYPVGVFFFFFSCVLLRFVMALRAFRRTVSLDVLLLAGSNDHTAVSSFIVEHFTCHKIHAVQFIGTTSKVTFAVEARQHQ